MAAHLMYTSDVITEGYHESEAIFSNIGRWCKARDN